MLLKLLHRWRREAGQAGRNIKRIVVAFEAGRDGFWLARWLRARDVEGYVIHPTSIAVSLASLHWSVLANSHRSRQGQHLVCRSVPR
jgi:hypothetical protein